MKQASQQSLLTELVDKAHKAEGAAITESCNAELMNLIREDPGHPLSVMARTALEFDTGEFPTPEEQFVRITRRINDTAEEYVVLVADLARLKHQHPVLPSVKLATLAISETDLLQELRDRGVSFSI